MVSYHKTEEHKYLGIKTKWQLCFFDRISISVQGTEKGSSKRRENG